MGWSKSSRALVLQSLALTSWWSRARRGVLHLDKHVATADVDVVSGRLAEGGLVAIVGELDEARLTGEVGGELVHEELVIVLSLLKCSSIEGQRYPSSVVLVVRLQATLLVLRVHVLGLDQEAFHLVCWKFGDWDFGDLRRATACHQTGTSQENEFR